MAALQQAGTSGTRSGGFARRNVPALREAVAAAGTADAGGGRRSAANMGGPAHDAGKVFQAWTGKHARRQC